MSKNINVPTEIAIFVTADVMVLYKSVPRHADPSALKEALRNRSMKYISIENLIKMTELALRNNCFEYNYKMFRQKSVTAIGKIFALPYACIYMVELSRGF